MNLLGITGIALALSFDSFTAAVTCGLNCKPMSWKYRLLIPFSFAVFQAGMPLIGYFASYNLLQYINSWDHWLAFALLFLIGFHMIREPFLAKKDRGTFKIGLRMIITMSIATSIDALATGFSLGLLRVNIWLTTAIIFIITFTASVLGLMTGKIISTSVLKKWTGIIGGLILIAIGIKVLIDHALDHGFLQ